MSMFNAMKISSSAMAVQMVRMNTTASNLANMDVMGSSPDEAYKAKRPIFQTLVDKYTDTAFEAGVKVSGIQVSDKSNVQRYEPTNPLANDEGYIYMSNVNSIEEMVDMTNATRSYQTNVEVMNATKKMMLGTLALGR